jgi:hypothetical protein
MENFNDILAALDNANKKLEKTIYIPSLDTDVPVRPINAQHTKKLIKTTVEGPFAANQFNIIVYGILRDILDVDLKTISVYDKPIILLQLRAQNISPDISVEFTELKTSKKINIDKHLKKFKKGLKQEPVTITKDGITGTINYTSIEDEYLFDNFLYQTQMSKIDQRDVNQMKSLVAPIFMNSLVMFLTSLTIGEATIDLTSLSVDERLKLADRLPSSFLSEAIAKIDDNFGKNLQKVLSVSTTHEGTTYESEIELDAGFFLQ